MVGTVVMFVASACRCYPYYWSEKVAKKWQKSASCNDFFNILPQ